MARKVLSVCYEQCLPDETLEFLTAAGYQMTCARALGAAVHFFNRTRFDAILINQTVSNPQEQLLVELVRKTSQIPIVFISEHVEAEPTGVTVWLKPPISPEILLQVISELLPSSRSASTNER